MLFVDRIKALKTARYAISKVSNASSKVGAVDLAFIVNECDTNMPVSALTNTDAHDVFMPTPITVDTAKFSLCVDGNVISTHDVSLSEDVFHNADLLLSALEVTED